MLHIKIYFDVAGFNSCQTLRSLGRDDCVLERLEIANAISNEVFVCFLVCCSVT